MPIERPRPRRAAAVRFGIGLAGALALLISVAPAANAHAELVASSPAANAVLPSGPERVSLTFSEPIDPGNATVELLDAEQRTVDGLGAVRVVDDGRYAQVALPELDPGTYTVSYLVVSTLDGHATAGSFAFLVDPDGTATPAAARASFTSSPSVAPSSIGARWIGLAGGLVAIGSLVMWWNAGRASLSDRAPEGREAPWGLVTAAAAIAFAGTALYLVLAARPILEGPGGGIALDPVAPYGWTPFAIAMRITLAGTFGVAFLGLLRPALPHHLARSDRLAAAAGVVLALALAGMSAAGHAASIGGPLAGAVDWVHMLAVATWLGGLPAALVLARRASGPSGSTRATALAILRRHGRLALVAAPVAVLTGVANSRLVLGEPRDLLASDYGNLLVAKAILVSVALGAGAVNHFALRGRGRARIGALLTLELAVAVLAIGAAATMVTIQPASGRQPVAVGLPLRPAHLFATIGPASVHASVTYPIPGSQTWLVSVADPETGGPSGDVQAVWLELTPPAESGLPASGRVTLEPTDDPGIYAASGAHTPLEGVWGVDLVVRRQGALDERAELELEVTSPPPAELAPPPDTGIDVPGPLGALWPLVPPGALAWLLAGLAIAALWGVARSDLPRAGRRAAAGALAVGFVLIVGAAGTRDLVALANAAPHSNASEAPEAEAGAIQRGERLYLANCASCHGRRGDGDGPVRTLPAAGPLADAVGRMSPAEVEYRIANGMAGTSMPAFVDVLSESERWDLVAYLRQRFAD